MSNIQSVNYDTKRIYLHSDTVTAGFNATEAYFEINVLRAANANNEQNRLHPMSLADKLPKGLDKNGNPTFTPVYAIVENDWRFIPYGGVTHKLYLGVEIVSKEQLVDDDVFDFTGLTVNVHIIPDYSPQEIIEINTGSSALTPEENAQLMGLPDEDLIADTVLDKVAP